MLNFKQTYSKLSSYDYIILKSVILRFLQGKNVKVSIFIQDDLQDNNSIIYLPMNEISPPFVGKLGVVKDYSNNSEDSFELKLNDYFRENNNNNRMDNFDVELGKNMYGSEKLKIIGRKKNQETPENAKNNEEEKEKENKIKNENNFKKESKPAPEFNKPKNIIKDSIFAQRFENRELSKEQKLKISQGNQKDLLHFSSIFSSPSYDNKDLFQFDLFGLNDQNNNNKTENDENFINIQRSTNNIKNKMNQEFDNLNEQKKDEDEDDLLDLMDKNI